MNLKKYLFWSNVLLFSYAAKWHDKRHNRMSCWKMKLGIQNWCHSIFSNNSFIYPTLFSTNFGVIDLHFVNFIIQNKKGKYNYLIFHFRCNTTFEQQMLGLLYVLFLVTMVVVLSFKAKGVRENYREAMYIGLTMGFTVCIFLVWILGGFIAPPEYQVLNGKKSFELWCMYLKGW